MYDIITDPTGPDRSCAIFDTSLLAECCEKATRGFIDFSVSVSFFVQWCQLIPVILLFFRVQASRLVGEWSCVQNDTYRLRRGTKTGIALLKYSVASHSQTTAGRTPAYMLGGPIRFARTVVPPLLQYRTERKCRSLC